MIKKTDIIADMHTHTNFSKHAFSTLKENIEAAHDAGLKYMVTCDHYYNDGTDIERKNELDRISHVAQHANPNKYGVRVIGSVECNLNQDRRADLNDKILNGAIKYRPIGLHSWFVDIKTLTLEEVFQLFKNSHKYFDFNVFVHIERGLDKVCYGRYAETIDQDLIKFFHDIVTYAKDKNVLLEVNESSIAYDNGHNSDKLRVWLRMAKENGNRIVLGTDAHYCEEVGRFDNVIALLNEVDYPKELILNCDEEQILNLLNG